MSRRPPPERGRVNNRTDVDFEIRIPNVAQEPPTDDSDNEFITPGRARAIRVQIDMMKAAGDWPPNRCEKTADNIALKITPPDQPETQAQDGCTKCSLPDDATCYIPARHCGRTVVAVG